MNQAEGSMVKTDGEPDESLVPSLLTLSDVMATGWHAAVAAGVRRGVRRSWSATERWASAASSPRP